MQVIQTKTLSPKELAQVVGVSESSIKRWVDDGLIDVIRTAGGHRRILVGEALRFIRMQRMRVLRPEVLGLPDLLTLAPEHREQELTGDLLFELLSSGHASEARAAVLNHYLNGGSVAALLDGPMADALTRIGELWHSGHEGIFREHVATNIVIEALHVLRSMLPPVRPDAPIAAGGSPPGDPYLLPNLMAATIMAEAGYRDLNLGASTPWPAFRRAIEINKANFVWIAATSHLVEIRNDEALHDFLAWLLDSGVFVVAGGQAARAATDLWPEGVRLIGTMAELSEIARACRKR